MLRTSKEQDYFKAYLAESYIKSFDLGISLPLDLLFFRENEKRNFARKPPCGALLLTAELASYHQNIECIAETFIFKSSPASDKCR